MGCSSALSETASVADVSEYYLGLEVFKDVQDVFVRFLRGASIVEVPVTADTLGFMRAKAWCRQLTACKTMQVVKVVAKSGFVSRPRKERQKPHDFSGAISQAASIYRK